MLRKIKALALALAAAFALSAAMTSAASAQVLHSGSGAGTTYLTLDQHEFNILHTELGNWQCTTINGSGSFTGTTTSEVTFSNVTYSGCTAYGQTAHFAMNGCSYTVSGTNATTGKMEIICPAGKSISITPTQGGVAICHVNLGPQTINLSITNTTATGGGTIPDDIDMRPEGAITYTSERTAGGSKCPTNGTHTDGNYTNYTTVTGFSDVAHTVRTTLTYT